MDTEICIANDLINHDLWLCLDTDNDPNTGYPQQTGYGTELAINFLDHYAWFNTPDPNIQVPFVDIGLKVAPTVTSSTFEIAIDRNAVPNGIDSLFTNSTIRILVKDNLDNDKMPNVGDVFYYTFDETPVNTFTPLDLNKEDSTFIRVISFNIFENAGWGTYPNIENIESLLTAMDGDIYCFQECSANSAAEIKAYMDDWLPFEDTSGWYVTKHNDIITCSKWPFLETWHNLYAKYPTLIDLPASYPKDLLVINSHLSFGMNNAYRQEQVDEFAAFVLDAKTPGGDIDLPEYTPIVFLRDMNFVGYAQQPITAITGDIQNVAVYGQGGPLDWDDTDLTDAASLHSDQKMIYTWRTLDNEDHDFSPGKLDYQIYTDAALNKEKGFILQTGVMSPERLALYGLNIEDSHQVSDHLPHVVDYSIIPHSEGFKLGLKVFIEGAYNPANDSMYVVVWHRNHLGIMSSTGISPANGDVVSYDFSTGPGKVYNGPVGFKELKAGVWGMVSGDTNADGLINEDDKTYGWSTETGESGYLGGDLNLDGQSNNQDKNDMGQQNNGAGSQIPD